MGNLAFTGIRDVAESPAKVTACVMKLEPTLDTTNYTSIEAVCALGTPSTTGSTAVVANTAGSYHEYFHDYDCYGS